MKSSFFKREQAGRRGLHYRLILIEALVVVLPLCAMAFILHDRGVTFETRHLWIIALILVLVLCGMLILRQIIDRILSVVVMVRPTEAGIVQTTLRDDLAEIREIEQTFGRLVGQLEKTAADLNRRSTELLSLRELVEVAKSSLDLPRLQELTLEKAMSATGARMASFLLVDAAENRFRIAAVKGPEGGPQKNISIPLKESPAHLAVTERKAVLVENIEEDPRIHQPNNPRYGSPSFLCLPVMIGDEVSAVISLAGKPEGEAFNEDDEKIASVMLREVNFAFENARLHLKIQEQLKQIEEKNLALQDEIAQREKLASELRVYQGQLKDLVQERTSELMAANQKLQWEVRVRQEAESALRASEERLRTIIDSARDWIFIKDRQGRYLSVNASMLRELALSPAEILGRPAAEIFSERQAEEMCRKDENVLAGNAMEYEMALELGGAKAFFNVVKVPIRDAGGQVVSLCGIARNVTERRKLEAQYIDAQKMEAVGILAGGLAHDFNNLLMGIQGYTSLMMLHAGEDDPHFEKLKAVEQLIASGTDLARQLLGVSKGGDHAIRPIDVNAVVERTAGLFGRTKKEVRIAKNFAVGLPSVEADGGQVEQVLLNLFVNAWQAMPGGGDLFLETAEEVLEERDTAPHSIPPGSYVRITVRDTGIGMDEETLSRIFDPFFPTKERGFGTGLGLTTVYGIVKGYRGFLRVASTKGSGTTFDVFLPVSQRIASREDRESGEEIASGSGRILLVDDEHVILEVTRDMLESLGYRVITACAGEEALEIYRRSRDEIDLVILDVTMPGMGGGETMSRLKSFDPDARILLSSGYGSDACLQAEMSRASVAFIQKPYRLDKLSRKVREMMDREAGTAGAS